MSDAECCVSGAFFRTFPRVTMYAMDSGLNEETVYTQLRSIAKDIMGYRKPMATVTVPQDFAVDSQEVETEKPQERER